MSKLKDKSGSITNIMYAVFIIMICLVLLLFSFKPLMKKTTSLYNVTRDEQIKTEEKYAIK